MESRSTICIVNHSIRHYRFAKYCFVEVGIIKDCAQQIGPGEDRLFEVAATHVCFLEVGCAEIGIPKVAAHKRRTHQHCPGKLYRAKITVFQVSKMDCFFHLTRCHIRVSESGIFKFCILQVSALEIHAVKNRTCQIAVFTATGLLEFFQFCLV